MNLIQRIFRSRTPPQTVERAELMSGSTAQFTAMSGGAYSSDIYRAAVDAIARNAAKLKGSHVVRTAGEVKERADQKLDRLLQVQPNPYMNAYDLIYKMTTHYYLHNNAFAYIQRDDSDNVKGIYPISGTSMEFMADAAGIIYCRFLFGNGRSAILPYGDIVHLRRHFNDNDLLGSHNDAILPALELAHTQNEGIMNAIKSSANIRGILKYTQIMAPEKLKQESDQFVKDYLSINNSGGVIMLDQKMEYQPIEAEPVMIDEKQIGATREKIHDYLGVSEAIVNSSYTEDQWAAFYESTIEPLATLMSLEFTRRVFTDREQAFGNSILFESGRLQFSSNKTKIELINQLMPYGMLTINQALEILNLPGIEDGDRRLQTLNVIDAATAKNYQLNRNLKMEAIKDLSDTEADDKNFIGGEDDEGTKNM